MCEILFYIGGEDEIMSIQHFSFEQDSELDFLSNIPVVQIPEVGETCIKVERFSHASLCANFFLLLFLCMILFFCFYYPHPNS